ncbi:glycosyltransferase family 4 protein [Roseinatronobacter sp. NSM]|uniref:glycosyltransferase family 4 protein n=1 Tax=Roseinatronobacter sp. NSM TaxID=3457785 RepID=UPI00403725F8
MSVAEIAFALPGDIQARSGGTQYDRRVIETLRALGQPVRHLALPASWPAPDAHDTAATLALLRGLPPHMPVIIDGLAFGAMQTRDVAALDRRVIVMLHHPLGLETGLPQARAAELMAREGANLRHAAHVIVPSGHIKEILAQQFGVDGARVTIAPPGFDRAAPALPVPRKDDPPLILTVGLICERKGHDVLMRALGRIADLDWQSVIVGAVQDDALLARLKGVRDDLGLRNRVRFQAGMPPQALSDYYNRAHMFALATRYEGYGMVISEAQLHGLPIVTCAAGAVPETMRGAGLLVPPDDADAFAQALRDLLTDAGLHDALSRKSQRAGATLPDWTDTAQVFLQVIGNLAAP